jgi:hypothetical protein
MWITPTPALSVMKTLKFMVLALVALGTSGATRAESSAELWLETYYINPRSEELTANIRALSREGFFEKEGNIALGIGFLATIFAENPRRAEGWLRELSNLPAAHQRLVAAALWQAGHPLGSELLGNVSKKSLVQDEVLRLASIPAQLVVDTPVRSRSSLNLQWGAFLASGDERHIVRVLDAIGTGERALDNIAQMNLARHAANHPRVLEICRAQLSRQPQEVQSVLRAALRDVEATPRI